MTELPIAELILLKSFEKKDLKKNDVELAI